MTGIRLRRALVSVATTLVLPSILLAQAAPKPFDHLQHRSLFPDCRSCHQGVESAAGAAWPKPEGCASCHDGVVEKRVSWQPPVAEGRNLRFTHARHAELVGRAQPTDSALSCAACHNEAGAVRMDVLPAAVTRCLECHGVKTAHMEAPDTACATCHLPLAEAKDLTREQIARFDTPPSHRMPEFLSAGGHGAQAGPITAGGRSFEVAPSCATCHAREFCVSCHVNAPEVKVIQALAPDPRSTALTTTLQAPESHRGGDFASEHRSVAEHATRSCATCHTRESCIACHATQPRAVRVMPVAGPGRGAGAVIVRRRPDSHGADFADSHGPLASARASACATCHARSECLDCHRGSPAASAEYHPRGFLSRHPAAAYARETTCSDCHGNGSFCQACHAQAGLVNPGGALRGGLYHDAQPNFLFGHGQAARQSLETCVGCHAERDCLTCHSSVRGRGFNPHGPGFDAERLRHKNREVCTACHGAAVPGGP